jgi:hypothetical protein
MLRGEELAPALEEESIFTLADLRKRTQRCSVQPAAAESVGSPNLSTSEFRG